MCLLFSLWRANINYYLFRWCEGRNTCISKASFSYEKYTERPEGITSGTVKLVGTTRKPIISNVEQFLQNQIRYDKMAKVVNPYGDGESSRRILDYIKIKIWWGY